MPLSQSLPTRLICVFAAAALLTACGDAALKEVRNGPQEVHPSPSELAKVPLYECGTHGQAACE